ncbi:uncharacterized protein TNCV_448891 [Trichonephila clavipes]|nr:uncharacterized protein TNCV_448891 [Trichonephila clavipes]
MFLLLRRDIPRTNVQNPKGKEGRRGSQGFGSWLASHEFEPSTTKDPPCRGAKPVKSVESSHILPLRYAVVRRGGCQIRCRPRHLTTVQNYEVDRQKLSICDEAHFWLNGYVNKQNCRIWSEANPQVYVETPFYPEKLTVWSALWAGGILLQKR